MSENYPFRDSFPLSLNLSHFIIRDGEYWMTAETIGDALGYQTPRESVLKLCKQHREVLEHFGYTADLTPWNGARRTRLFNEEGIYLISLYSGLPSARGFQLQLTRFLKKERMKKQKILDYLKESMTTVWTAFQIIPQPTNGGQHE
jgi:prophage antirepressor-like protein